MSYQLVYHNGFAVSFHIHFIIRTIMQGMKPPNLRYVYCSTMANMQ